ncbi:MAG: hypothetical protein M3O70_05880 [Actinomycetota bacterium]|nr:hypothetical protein [Actinomycetota bacterium]
MRVLWNRSTFPVVVGERGCQEVADAVVVADPVEQHRPLARPEPASEHLAIVGEDPVGHAMAAQRPSQSLTPVGP